MDNLLGVCPVALMSIRGNPHFNTKSKIIDKWVKEVLLMMTAGGSPYTVVG
jgi:hypothetical protein